ncbi:hypothetical protein [Herbaspirillum rhizosphaerae]|uniref:hypothetical protein n=1 Tax=Herbaspirillum rhizosphaerae TaxID=346179 RepID=UPI0012ED0C3A|nr:hypothetical protein [Herbaspirillum rhizosphaerae]
MGTKNIKGWLMKINQPLRFGDRKNRKPSNSKSSRPQRGVQQTIARLILSATLVFLFSHFKNLIATQQVLPQVIQSNLLSFLRIILLTAGFNISIIQPF